MATYTDNAYNKVMEKYSKLPAPLKEKAGNIVDKYSKNFKQGEAPPHEMEADLEELAGGKDLESIVKSMPTKPAPKDYFSFSEMGNGSKLAALAAGVLLFAYTGIPYFP